jgi:hypothetical protein
MGSKDQLPNTLVRPCVRVLEFCGLQPSRERDEVDGATLPDLPVKATEELEQ